MNTYKYQFTIDQINLREKNFDEDNKDIPKDKQIVVLTNKLVGTPISVILEDPKDFPNEGTFFAKNQAEDKASEIIATLIGLIFGGTQKHLANYREDANLKGRFVSCKLESIEQVGT